MRRRLVVAAWCGILLAMPSLVRAGFPVPDPNHSDVPACLLACPQGDAPYTVVIRDFAGGTIAGAFVALDFSNCPAFVHCHGTDPGTHYDDANHRAGAVTNAIGIATLNLAMGGTCPGGQVKVYADGVLMRTVAYVSPDLDGDQDVDGDDDALMQSKLGSADPVADLDCSGQVTAQDAQILTTHLGHVCDGATRARPYRWGELKLLYR